MSLRQARGQRPSLRAAIDKYCKQCSYDETDAGTWRQQVTLCPSSECPLYRVRPLSEDSNTLLDAPRRGHQSIKTAISASALRSTVDDDE